MPKSIFRSSVQQLATATSALAMTAAMATAETPLEETVTRWVNFDTAETLPEKQFSKRPRNWLEQA